MLEYINTTHTDALGRLFFPSLSMEFKDDTCLSEIKIAGCTELTIRYVNIFNTHLSVINATNAVTALIESQEQIRNMDHIVKGISPVYVESQCIDITNQEAVIELIEALAERLYAKSSLISKGISRSALKIIIAGDSFSALLLNKYKRHSTDDPNSFADWDIVGSVDKRLDSKMFISLQAIDYSPVSVDAISYGSHLNGRIHLVSERDALVLQFHSKHVLNLPILAAVEIGTK